MTAEGWAEMPTRTRAAVSFAEHAGGLDEPTEVTPVDAHTGQLLRGRYRLDEILVRRADTQTWRAHDLLLARPVLVHTLRADRPNHGLLAAAKRASAAADFRVLRVLDAATSPQAEGSKNAGVGPYVVCEYAPGQTLEQLVSDGPVSALEAAWIVREVADALVGMHAAGLYHQRLSPTTVVVTDTGNIKIVGFLLEAELDSGQHPLDDPEDADVTALGQLLYALLVSRWPERQAHGMAAAPTDADGRLLRPREVRGSVPPSLDQICHRILNRSPRDGATPLRTAAAVSAALSRVLGTADAAQDLEQRVHVSDRAGEDPTVVHDFPEAYAKTAPVETVPADAHEPYPATVPVATVSPNSSITRPTPNTTRDPSTPVASAGRLKKPARWRRALVSLAVVAAVGGVATVGWRLAGAPGAAHDSAATSAQWPVVAAQDFDPEGNGEEHPNEVSFAWDGNPATSWTTMNYFEAEIGNKTGVGLVFDLGEVRQLSRVELDLDGQGTSLDVRIPNGDAASVTTAPMSSASQWRTVGTAIQAPAATSISLDEPVQTRFVLVFLTHLPPAGGQFTGGVAEARFWS